MRFKHVFTFLTVFALLAGIFSVSSGPAVAAPVAQTNRLVNADFEDGFASSGVANFWDDDFTALEVWIHTTRGHILNNFIGQNTGNWFNLLNQGRLRSGIASSDTHTLNSVFSGFPRTFVASTTDDPALLVFGRRGDEGSVVVAANFADEPRAVSGLDGTGTDLLRGGSVDFADLRLEPFGFGWFARNE